MPAGCEFICHNEKCEHHNSGFGLTAQWPLGHIGLVINQASVRLNSNFRNGLIALKDSGRKYACISLPNIEGIEVAGWRVQKWCKKCMRIWQYDAIKNGNETMEEAISNASIPDVCPIEGEVLLSFNEVIEQGIDCPHCNQTLFQSRWFSSETEKNR
ncbi:MAG: hypothetical protein WC375_05660 [Methanomassiliicoccales archaeon]|jgi:hypothetical protein